MKRGDEYMGVGRSRQVKHTQQQRRLRVPSNDHQPTTPPESSTLPAMASQLSEYEWSRLKNIQDNQQVLIALGLAKPPKPSAPRPPKPPAAQKKKRAAAAAQPGARRKSLRSSSEAPTDSSEPATVTIAELKRPSTKLRLTNNQQLKLEALDINVSGPLSPIELNSLEFAREELAESVPQTWREAHTNGETIWQAKRRCLHYSAQLFGLRWPRWLSEIEEAIEMAGDDAREHTMYTLEAAAVGFGFPYAKWPAGAGVLLSDGLGSGPLPKPRPLTLGSDTELLKREGHYLEHRFAPDKGNGWVYNHALGKLRLFQEKLLTEQFEGDAPAAPSVRDMEDTEDATPMEEDTV